MLDDSNAALPLGVECAVGLENCAVGVATLWPLVTDALWNWGDTLWLLVSAALWSQGENC